MRILVEMTHPKDVNTFKHVIRDLENRGHEIKIAARNKESVLKKLDEHGFDYVPGPHYKKMVFKALGLINVQWWLLRVARSFKPDLFIGPSSMYSAYVSKWLNKPYICFSDVEKEFTFRFMLPFTNAILIPSCFERKLPKEVRFNGYIELCYLHSNHFEPNPDVLSHLGLSEDDSYILLRISSLDAFHDVGAKGLNFTSSKELKEFIQKLEPYGQVFLTSEVDLDEEFNKYELNIPVNELQSCIYYAKMYVGDGASMAAEAAILGTPSIYVTNTRQWGFTNDLERNYGLIHSFSDRDKALEKAIELLEDPSLKKKWDKKRKIMLNEKIDTAKFMVDYIENFISNSCKGNGKV